MDLYFAPMACSMASRIALYEAGADARFVYVDTKSKRLADGSDFLAINPMGQVPALRTDDGEILTENPVVLQYIADRYPDSGLAPPAGRIERYKLMRWLNFVTSELHKFVFTPLLTSASPEGAKTFAREKADQRFKILDDFLDGTEFLLDRFTVADCYLVTVLNWSAFAGLDLAAFPAVQAYFRRLQSRPSVSRAMADELVLYKEEKARRQAA